MWTDELFQHSWFYFLFFNNDLISKTLVRFKPGPPEDHNHCPSEYLQLLWTAICSALRLVCPIILKFESLNWEMIKQEEENIFIVVSKLQTLNTDWTLLQRSPLLEKDWKICNRNRFSLGKNKAVKFYDLFWLFFCSDMKQEEYKKALLQWINIIVDEMILSYEVNVENKTHR